MTRALPEHTRLSRAGDTDRDDGEEWLRNDLLWTGTPTLLMHSTNHTSPVHRAPRLMALLRIVRNDDRVSNQSAYCAVGFSALGAGVGSIRHFAFRPLWLWHISEQLTHSHSEYCLHEIVIDKIDPLCSSSPMPHLNTLQTQR